MQRRLRVVLLCLGWLGGCATPDPTATDDFSLPGEALRHSRAMARYTQGLLWERGPDRDPERAMADFRQAVDLAPAAPAPRDGLLRNLRASGRHDEAYDVLRRATQATPDDFELWWELASQAESLQRFDSAAVAYERAARLAPESRRVELTLGAVRCRFADDRDRQALRTLRAMARQHESGRVRGFALQWAQHFVRQERIDRALPCIALALGLTTSEPERSHLREMLANGLLRDGQRRAAAREYRRLLRADPFRIGPAVRLAEARFGREPEAMRNGLAQRLRRRPDEVATLLALAFLEHDAGAHDAAAGRLETVRAAIRRHPTPPDADLFAFMSAVLADADRFETAEELLGEGLETHPDEPLLLNNLAYLWAERKQNLETALAYARQAVAADPANGAYLDTLGWTYYRLARYDEALNYMLEAVQRLPEDAVILDHAGDVLAALGRGPEARAYWRRSHELAPQKTRAGEKIGQQGGEPGASGNPDRPPPDE